MTGFFDVMKQPPIKLGEEYPLFTRVSLETASFCNRACSFCPIAWSGDERGTTYMADDLFRKTIDELAELGFNGVLQMFLLNEPTIDRSMIEKLECVRREMPKVTTYISTNGDVFDAILKKRGWEHAVQEIERYYDAGLTGMNLNVYDSGTEQLARYGTLVSELLDRGVRYTYNKYRKHPVSQRFVSITDMRSERLTVESTDLIHIHNKDECARITNVPQKHCSRAQRHIVILYSGKVPICCAIDPTDIELPIMGDVNHQTLKEIWNDEPMFRYRFFTQQAQRILPGCSTCTHRMAYPHVVRRVTADDGVIERWRELIDEERNV